MITAQQAFTSVKNLLVNFRQGIVDEQKDADVRNEKDVAECTEKIAAAEKLVQDRQNDVDSLKSHIDFLENEKKEHEKDVQTREERLIANAQLLENFKKQRCDNNLLFVKELREHMEAVDVLNLLKGDLNDYFANKKVGGVNPAFIERFAEFSHLLNDEHKEIFMQLSAKVSDLPDVNALSNRVSDSTATKQRTGEEVGTNHVDNDKGELQKLDHVAYEGTAEYNANLQTKVIGMIDGLIKHLKESRDALINNEIKAAEDFAVFQTNMEKENEHLKNKIAELKKAIEDLVNQLNIANEQLEKRKKLLQDAQNALATIRQICSEKKEYYQKESSRRTGELSSVDSASKIFDDILSNLSKRVTDRASNLNAGAAEAGNHVINNVKNGENPISTGVDSRVNARNAVVF